MTPDRLRDVVLARLADWAELAVGDHATPAVLVCIGHDHRRGTIGVTTVEGVSDLELVALLKEAIRTIRAGRAERG